MPKILVALDGTDDATRVATFVNSFFGGLDVEIVALHVGTVPAPWYPAGVTPGALFAWPYPLPAGWQGDQGTVEAAVEAGEETIERSGLDSDEDVVELGDPLMRIKTTAVDEMVDLIVVGSSHKGLLERLLAGSVSRDLSRDAPTPVLIVH